MNVEEFRDVLMRSYPKLREAGGFLLYKCHPNSRNSKGSHHWALIVKHHQLFFYMILKADPTASTCSIQLRLPITHGDKYQSFKEDFLLAIVGNDGFGGI